MRLRHRLRKLWASGQLQLARKAPAWIFQAVPPQEASPEETATYLESQAAAQPSVLTEGYCVGVHKETGRMLFSGASCLDPTHYEIKLTGTREECRDYVRSHY